MQKSKLPTDRNFHKSFQTHSGRVTLPPFTAENGLPRCVCTVCAMPTADESNHSAAGTLHSQRTDGTHDDDI